MARIKQHNGIRYIRRTPWYKWDKLYELLDDYAIDIQFTPSTRIDWGRYCTLTTNGVLTIRKGFLFGPSGPTIDTKNAMRGSLVHDALYAALRSGKLLYRFGRHGGMSVLDHDELRIWADLWILKIMQEDGMSMFRSKRWYDGLRIGGASAARPNGEKKALKLAL